MGHDTRETGCPVYIYGLSMIRSWRVYQTGLAATDLNYLGFGIYYG